MKITANPRLGGGTPLIVPSESRRRISRVTAGIAIGLGCTALAAAILGAGIYAGSTRNAFATAANDDDTLTTAATHSVAVKTAPSAIAARFPALDALFEMRDDTNTNPTFAFAIPADVQIAGVQPAPKIPAAPKLASVAVYNAKADDAKSARGGTQLASLGPATDLDNAVPDDSRTAYYDITAQALYMPNGEKLEAHSGLGVFMDSPRHTHLKMKGATPPNAYRLTMREALFHGHEAVRMNPENEEAMMGRAGILVHPYMLGPTGESNGCISLKDYATFLAAFKRGEVDRIVVVTRLDSPPAAYVRANPLASTASAWKAWLQKIL